VKDLARAVIGEHASRQAAARDIPEAVVLRVLGGPERVLEVRPGRVVAQAVVRFGETDYMVRVFVDVDRDPPEVVTCYRTSKMRKYRSQP